MTFDSWSKSDNLLIAFPPTNRKTGLQFPLGIVSSVSNELILMTYQKMLSQCFSSVIYGLNTANGNMTQSSSLGFKPFFFFCEYCPHFWNVVRTLTIPIRWKYVILFFCIYFLNKKKHDIHWFCVIFLIHRRQMVLVPGFWSTSFFKTLVKRWTMSTALQ